MHARGARIAHIADPSLPEVSDERTHRKHFSDGLKVRYARNGSGDSPVSLDEAVPYWLRLAHMSEYRRCLHRCVDSLGHGVAFVGAPGDNGVRGAVIDRYVQAVSVALEESPEPSWQR